MPAEERPWLRLFAHPTVGLIGAIASLFGLLAAVYFYWAARAVPEITVYVHPVRATVVKTGQASTLTVFHKAKPIITDITAAQVAIWNAGKLAVRGSDILQPILIKSSAPILEVSIRKVSRAVVRPSVDVARLADGTIGIAWNILEQNDGVILQVVYAGTPTAKFSTSGTVVGQKAVIQVGEQTATATSLDEQRRSKKRILYFSAWGMVLGGVLIFVFALIREYPTPSRRHRGIARFGILAVLYVGFGIAVLLLNREMGPPFGF